MSADPLVDVRAEGAARAVVLTGGDRAIAAGADLTDYRTTGVVSERFAATEAAAAFSRKRPARVRGR